MGGSDASEADLVPVWMSVDMARTMINLVRDFVAPQDQASMIAIFERALEPQAPTVDVTKPNEG